MNLNIEWPDYVGEPGWEYKTTSVFFYGTEKELELSRIKRKLLTNPSPNDVDVYMAYLGADPIPQWTNIATGVKIGYVDDSLRQWIREAGMILAVPTSVDDDTVYFRVSKRIGGEKPVLDEIERQMREMIEPSNRHKRMNMRQEFSFSPDNTWHELEEYDRLKAEGRKVIYELLLEDGTLKICNRRDFHVAFSIDFPDDEIVDYLERRYSCFAEIKSYERTRYGKDITFWVYVMY